MKPLRLAGWFLTIVGVLWAVYGGAQVVLGLMLAVKSPQETGHLAGALSGAALFAAAALVAWGGRRLRMSAGGRPRAR
jgi:heme A synthase